MLAYIAGPLFNEGERWFVEKICAQAEAAGFETFLPHRDTPPEYVIPRNPAAIFRSDLDYLERAALVGIYTDLRLTFPGQVTNLILEHSLNRMTRSLEELEEYLMRYGREQGLQAC